MGHLVNKVLESLNCPRCGGKDHIASNQTVCLAKKGKYSACGKSANFENASLSKNSLSNSKSKNNIFYKDLRDFDSNIEMNSENVENLLKESIKSSSQQIISLLQSLSTTVQL